MNKLLFATPLILSIGLINFSFLNANNLENFLSIEQETKIKKEDKYYIITNINNKEKNTKISINMNTNNNTTIKDYNESLILIKDKINQLKNYTQNENEKYKNRNIHQSLEEQIERKIDLPNYIKTNEKLILKIKEQKIEFIKKSKYNEINEAIKTAINKIDSSYKNNKEIKLHIKLY